MFDINTHVMHYRVLTSKISHFSISHFPELNTCNESFFSLMNFNQQYEVFGDKLVSIP